MAATISPYAPEHRQPVLDLSISRSLDLSISRSLDLSIRAWEPVLPRTQEAVPAFLYDAFYPNGWKARQLADLSAVLDGEPENVDVALVAGIPAWWVCTRLRLEDDMGEIYVLAIDPQHQRQGIGAMLSAHSFTRVPSAGLRMVMVETGGDPGHSAARETYEALGFVRWPVARYFRYVRA